MTRRRRAALTTAFLLLRLVSSKVQYLGVAIAGMQFGCTIDGFCPFHSIKIPIASLGGGDGAGQMQHFVEEDGMNIFRLPVSWQFLLANQLGGSLDPENLDLYDQLMQICLETGAYCMLDIHNYARWNGGIIGQGGPTDSDFVNLWEQLAKHYAIQDRVIFQLMNEPQGLDISQWAKTCQKTVNAIRAITTTQMILLPGTDFSNAAKIVTNGSAEKLLAIRNPDGSTDGLILDIHKYLDVDNSGRNFACVGDNVNNFNDVAVYLRSVGRQGMITETGASSGLDCMTTFCAQNKFINQNSDVFIGIVGWAAGSFDVTYLLSETPSKPNGVWTDNALVANCLVGVWNTSEIAHATITPTVMATATSTSTTSPTATTSSKSGSAALRSSLLLLQGVVGVCVIICLHALLAGSW